MSSWPVLLTLITLFITPLSLQGGQKPHEKFRALTDEYQKALSEADATFLKAGTPEERKTIRAKFHKWRVLFLSRMIAFAESHPEDKEALQALFLHSIPIRMPSRVRSRESSS